MLSAAAAFFAGNFLAVGVSSSLLLSAMAAFFAGADFLTGASSSLLLSSSLLSAVAAFFAGADFLTGASSSLLLSSSVLSAAAAFFVSVSLALLADIVDLWAGGNFLAVGVLLSLLSSSSKFDAIAEIGRLAIMNNSLLVWHLRHLPIGS